MHYVDYDKTTENVRKEIKQGKPTEADLKDGSHAVYVYRKNNTCGVSIPKRGPELPNTGTVANTVSASFCSSISGRWSVLSEIKQDAQYY